MMKTYDSLNDLLESVPTEPGRQITFEIQSAFMTAWPKIHGWNIDGKENAPYPVIMAAISGGADSTVVLDMIERIGHPRGEVRYVFYDTGLEFEAAKRHLKYLENRYEIRIERRKAAVPVPLGVKKYGSPFVSKRISDYIGRLQRHGFQWKDKPLDELLREYPRCQSAVRWWCNAWGERSCANIGRRKWLKEFLTEHPPDFPISDKCCEGAKKRTARAAERECKPSLNIQGIRKAEGGVRATAYRTCFDEIRGGADLYRPVFWFQKRDLEAYARAFDVTFSDCYTVYGLKRTGCACCPFGRDFEAELLAAKTYEPKLYAAANRVFADSYRYTRLYRAYMREHDKEIITKATRI